jgi:hypothetical protein
MTRSEILSKANEIVTRDRAATHGDPENSFGIIAAYWSTHLDADVSPADVAVMMTLLKLARIRNNFGHADNWTDACGYLACGGEIAMRNDT